MSKFHEGDLIRLTTDIEEAAGDHSTVYHAGMEGEILSTTVDVRQGPAYNVALWLSLEPERQQTVLVFAEEMEKIDGG